MIERIREMWEREPILFLLCVALIIMSIYNLAFFFR